MRAAVWNGVGWELMKRGYLWFLTNLNLETMKTAFSSVDWLARRSNGLRIYKLLNAEQSATVFFFLALGSRGWILHTSKDIQDLFFHTSLFHMHSYSSLFDDFQKIKLYKKIHMLMGVKEEGCDGRWETLLFQPSGLGLTHISVSTHCSVCVQSLPKGMEQIMGCNGRAFQDYSCWWGGWGLLEAGLQSIRRSWLLEWPEGPGELPEAQCRGVAVFVHEATGDDRIQTWGSGQTEDLRSVTGELHSMVFTLVDLHSGLLVVDRVKMLAMFMLPGDNLQRWEVSEVAGLLPVHITIMHSQPYECISYNHLG